MRNLKIFPCYSGHAAIEYIVEEDMNKYSSRRLTLPVPKLVVFYNGRADMPEDCVLKPFLESHRAEVQKMLLTEYDEEKTMRQFKEEYLEEGIEIGHEKGCIDMLIGLAKDGLLSISIGASRAGMSKAAFEALLVQ